MRKSGVISVIGFHCPPPAKKLHNIIYIKSWFVKEVKQFHTLPFPLPTACSAS
jgi:hypothetical protein